MSSPRSAVALVVFLSGLCALPARAAAELLAVSDLAPERSSPDSIGRPPTTTAGLRYLAGAFHSLARAVDGADAAPTAGAATTGAPRCKPRT